VQPIVPDCTRLRIVELRIETFLSEVASREVTKRGGNLESSPERRSMCLLSWVGSFCYSHQSVSRISRDAAVLLTTIGGWHMKITTKQEASGWPDEIMVKSKY
jgi:hypothetical protein